MENHFKKYDKKSLSFIEKLGREAHRHGVLAYLVGGAVRDILLQRSHLDIDIVIDGDAIIFANQLKKTLKIKLTVYPQFGTVCFRHTDNLEIDLVSARKEHYLHPGSLPVVSPGSIKDDLFRRDFTINAMALCINPKQFGQLIDPWGGLRDLKNKKIRILHGQSFKDDPTRILRAVRFEQRFCFRMEPATLKLLKLAVNTGFFQTVKPPRYFAEFRKILAEENPLLGLKRLNRFGGLNFIEDAFQLNVKDIKHTYDIICPVTIKPKIYLLFLLAGLNEQTQKLIFKKFHLTAKEQKSFLQIRSISGIIENLLKHISQPSAIYKILKPLMPEVVWYTYLQVSDKKLKQALSQYLEKDQYCSLKITGEDLKKLGVISGQRMGRILKKVLYFKMDQGLRTKQDELKCVKTLYQFH
ncbi:tRNA nucleotidyltransferase, A-adding [hydrothermal vent metagenome]|uniref:tRNA nucleotidyltransferase, A-adding n=1 Tax=hydrothermal vent metagenome TaxID=652676 RepID=A0A3B1DJT2_9ZZZZ